MKGLDEIRVSDYENVTIWGFNYHFRLYRRRLEEVTRFLGVK